MSQKNRTPTISWHNFAKTSQLWIILAEKIKKLLSTSFDRNLGPMTLKPNRDLDILKMYICSENEIAK